ncbi:hypothetical protein JL100_035020 (plasmid) [Skermanella mucosa]|uniref:hypothetical protein n=1 Tax=Skermanella mucosa TaxID=1789672 RepID=UPI00192B2750|nr:hypothetical protein [Skermanella mucosa]UEM25275.1 hypothetical protein JL100_035020 [Skermanella mucosa]
MLTVPSDPLFAAEDDFTDPATTPPEAPPPANSETEASLQKKLPAGTPDYFKKIYSHFMKQPLPAKVFNQGGIPVVIPKLEIDKDPNGETGSYQPLGQTVTSQNAFFKSLGTNGRACVTCHQPASGMSISLRNIDKRLKKTKGADPLFAPVDGANCPTLVPASETSGSVLGGYKGKSKKDFKAARSLLLTRGVFRIALPLKKDEFTVEVISDPTTCNTDPQTNTNKDGDQILSVFRRPLMSANLHFKTAFTTFPIPGVPAPELSGNIMWDGREPTLISQAISATLGHAQALHRPTDDELEEIVAFETGIFSAQYSDKQAGVLSAAGALAGPVNLSANGDEIPAFGPVVFDEFAAWATPPGSGSAKRERESIARGEALFHGVGTNAAGSTNRGSFIINGVNGFNNLVGPNVPGTCSTCHNFKHSGADVLANSQRDIGIGGHAVSVGGPPPAKDLPIFKVSGCAPGTLQWDLGATEAVTNDLGKATLTGRCADIGVSTVPSLRALSAHEPYFRDGSAKTLMDVVNIYDKRFAIGLTNQEKQDLANFLSAL